MEHAAMLLEYIRRSDDDFAHHLKTYLFTEGNILAIEKAAEHGAPTPSAGAASNHGFTVGRLKED
jgi:hypothetical protein